VDELDADSVTMINEQIDDSSCVIDTSSLPIPNATIACGDFALNLTTQRHGKDKVGARQDSLD